jgi:hypothetical protein
VHVGRQGVFSEKLPHNIVEFVRSTLTDRVETKMVSIKKGPYRMYYEESGLPEMHFDFLQEIPTVDVLPLQIPYSRPGQEDTFLEDYSND